MSFTLSWKSFRLLIYSAGRAIVLIHAPTTQITTKWAAEDRLVVIPVLLARMFLLFFRPDSKIWIRHETDRQKCYGRETPANSTSRRTESNGRCPGPGFDPNPGNKKLKLDFAYPSNPGVS